MHQDHHMKSVPRKQLLVRLITQDLNALETNHSDAHCLVGTAVPTASYIFHLDAEGGKVGKTI